MMVAPKLRFKADDGSDFLGWEEKTLGELCAPLTYGMNAAATKFDGENRYIRITDIDDETHALLPDDIVSPSGELDDKYLVKKGDILLARTGASTGKSFLYHPKDGKLFYAGFLIKAHVLSSSDDYFIYSQTLTDRYWKWVKTASMRSGQPGINANEYASYSFAVPSLPEQRKIADFLSAVDAVIAAQQAEVDAWEQRKKGVMQKLFSQEVRFKADDGSDFPDWEEKTLGEVCFINPRTDALEDEFYYMDLGCVDRGMWEKPEVVSKKNAPNRAQRVAQIGDVFFQSVRPYNMGHYHYTNKMDKQVVASTGYIQTRMKNGCNAFLYQMFYEERFNVEVSMRCAGSNYPAITANKFSEIVAPFPSLPEQRKIADCLSSMDEVIQKAKDELAKWRELKKGLLQQMFV